MNRLFAQPSCTRLGVLVSAGCGVDDRRQHLEIDVDRIGEVLRFGAGRRDAGGNGLADITDLVRGQRRIARDLEPVDLRHRPHLGEARQVARGEDPSLGVGRDGDGLDAGMRVRAADKRHVLRVRQLHVGDELPAAVQVARVFLAQQRGADAEPGARRRVHHAVAFGAWRRRRLLAAGQRRRGRADGRHDIGIAGAAADVARQLLANLLLRSRPVRAG